MSERPPDQMQPLGDRPRGDSVPMETYKELHKTNAALLAQIETLKGRLATQKEDWEREVEALKQGHRQFELDIAEAHRAELERTERLDACERSEESLKEMLASAVIRFQDLEEATREAFTALLRVMPEAE